jgi:hypothetical protein
VEAKLSVLASSETRLLEQVNRYIAIDSFSPTVGARVGESFAASSSPRLPGCGSGRYLHHL